MFSKIRLYGLLVCLAVTMSAAAQELSDGARISLVTCSPGHELYARYGHTAIRVEDKQNQLDVIFNYGIFNFNTDHFYWRFVKGETWYELGAAPTYWFMQEYAADQRPVYEQTLHLTNQQRQDLWKALLENYKPENRQYLYNFVFDNCATRPYYLIAGVVGDTLISTYTGYTGQTYRRFLRRYTGALTWANAGINLIFGPKADQPMTNLQRLFLPEELMLYMNEATLSDGTPIVEKSTIAPFEIDSTPMYASWPFGFALYVIAALLISVYDRKRKRCSWWFDVLVAVPYLLLLLIVCFLTFFSCHPLVGFGWRLLIIPLTHLCARLIYILR